MMIKAPRDMPPPSGSLLPLARSFRVSPSDWVLARIRASEDKVTMSHVLRTFILGYGQGWFDLPECPLVRISRYRSALLDAHDWSLAQARADREGVTSNHIFTAIIYGYGHGLIHLPTVSWDFS